MPSPYNLNAEEKCTVCETLGVPDTIKFTTVYPKGSLLYVEGERPRGVFILCKGRVKLTTSSSEGKTLITKMSETGEILGAGETILGNPYQVSAETVEPCQVTFVRREDFMRLLNERPDTCMRTVQQLSAMVMSAQREIRSLGLSQTTTEKLAKLILNWCDNGETTPKGIRLKVLLTHEEIGQMVGTTRETVTRVFSEFKRRKIIDVKGSTFLVPQTRGLLDMVTI